MANKENEDKNNLPEEYIELVKQAMESNVTKEDFKKFLTETSEKRKKTPL